MAGNANAHEFWIAPEAYQVEEGDPVEARLRVGQGFVGAEQAYIPAHFSRFDMVQGGVVQPVKSRVGDRPALSQVPPEDGLWVIVHETTNFRLYYDEAETFRNFVTHKDLTGVLEAHEARGLPARGFYETYRRYAKSLIAVGQGKGQDRETGLLAEIIAETNPYLPEFDGQMRVLVKFGGEPQAMQQVELFERAPSGTVMTHILHTDGDGRAAFDVQPGHEYLADAVFMTPLDVVNPDVDPAWQSDWASLTFSVPAP